MTVASLCELAALVARTLSPLTRDFISIGRVSGIASEIGRRDPAVARRARTTGDNESPGPARSPSACGAARRPGLDS